MKVLVLNSGSSSIKYQLFDMNSLAVLASGMVERIGEAQGHIVHKVMGPDRDDEQTLRRSQPVADHRHGFELMGQILSETGAIRHTSELAAMGHRVVHGGEKFQAPVIITEEVMETIRGLVPLAPLHNPANLTGIQVAREYAPEIRQVAVFDTAFHQTIPEHAYLYALPRSMYEKLQVRRYGFHGTSHFFVAKEAAVHLGRDFSDTNLITLHLGNGASIAAIKNGRCVDTSMGMTPLAGLIMGTRCGDLDPAIIFYLARETAMGLQELDALLNQESGLKGICGDNDMRRISERAAQGDVHAGLALDMFCYRIRKYIGSYLAVLGRVDALVFTGGIGENAAIVREKVCSGLAALGMDIDRGKNLAATKGVRELQQDDGPVKVLVIPTNEELEIARQTIDVLLRLETCD
ncbi:MAG: acetate kinase [Proteobacteria bacterium]|nr:acetate kinase [Pseudomonadota bacterium]MBU0964856.1 acetate kinase [Pseudomonadota bacterium]